MSRPEATANYRKHPMGYACRDCGRAANVGKAIRHSSLCDIAPREDVYPAWPGAELLVRADEALAAGDPSAQSDVETIHGLHDQTPNRVTVCSRGGLGPYVVQSFERGRWTYCPGQWVSIADARRAAACMRGVHLPSTEFRVISAMDIDRPRRVVEFGRRLKGYELKRRGLIRLGDQLRAADDGELDEMWRPKSRVARARMPDPKPRPPRDSRPNVGMMRILRLEFLGHDVWSICKVRGMRPWVAGVNLDVSDWTGADGQRAVRVVDREFARGDFDYAESDKTGGRGVMLCYQLRQGYVYEVFDRVRRTGPRRVFMTHDGTCWHDLTPQEAFDAQGHARRRRADRCA